MSTRATVYVHWAQYGTVKLYHHCDGYISWLGNRIVRSMQENGWNDVIPSLFKIGWFEVDDVKSNHGDVEYVYDIYIGRQSIEFQNNKYEQMITWKVEVRKGYSEDRIKKQQAVEIWNGWSMKNDKVRVWEDEKIEKELNELEDRRWERDEDDAVESLDTNSNIYNAYYS